jgi:hypothetical protein
VSVLDVLLLLLLLLHAMPETNRLTAATNATLLNI